MKKIAILSFVLLMFGFTASAAEIISPANKMQGSVSTREQDVHKNLYIAGANVTVNGKTLSDLVAAGGVVTINGDVEKDLLLAGGNLTVNGTVGDNARIAGGNISISAPVTGDLLIGGGNITVAQKANVGGDLVIAGGNVTVDSDVKGNVKIGGGTIAINGMVSGKVEVMASQSLTFGPESQVLGTISFKGPVPAVVSQGAKVGAINYTAVSRPMVRTGALTGFLVIGSLFKLLMLLAAALVMCWLLPKKVTAIVNHAIDTPLHSLGLGLLVLIVTPILGVLLMVTVVGLYLGMIIFMIYGLFLILSSVLALFYTGNLVFGWYQKNPPVNHWRDLGLGAVVTFILGIIPIIGWIAICVLWLITLGALETYWYKEQVQS